MRRVLVHWMNLPAIRGPIALHAQTASGDKSWTGRWRANIDEWSITLDQRHDHTEVLKAAHATHLYVLTHVMEIRRNDGHAFNPQAAFETITADQPAAA
jgi:hypothetical protein